MTVYYRTLYQIEIESFDVFYNFIDMFLTFFCIGAFSKLTKRTFTEIKNVVVIKRNLFNKIVIIDL